MTRARAQDYMLTIVYVCRMRLVPNAISCLVELDDQPGLQGIRLHDDGLGNSPIFAGDYAPFKPRTDVTLHAAAYAPTRGKTTKLRVTFGVGSWRKSLDLVGDRIWQRNRTLELSEPQPFSRMPIRLENAFGGLDSRFNPWGKGFGTINQSSGSSLPACNIHSADRFHVAWDKDDLPDGFGPLPPDFLPRVALQGTHDKAWLYKRKPLPPEDFDWGFYNAAPPDQQFHPYLRGDETLFFENLSPKYPIFESQLPGIRPRIILQRTVPRSDQPQFEEPAARLDSLHIDTEAMTIDLAWRAVVSTPHPEGEDIPLCYIAREPIERPQPLASHVEAILAGISPPPPEPEIPPAEPPPPVEDDDLDYQAHMAHLRALVDRMPLPPAAKDAIMAAETPDAMEKLLTHELEQATKAAESLLGIMKNA